MEDRPLAVLPDDVVRQLLSDAGIDLSEALRKAGIRTELRSPTTASGEKDPVLLVAIGATAVMIAHAIERVIDAVGRNEKVRTSKVSLVPVTDGTGQTVRDSDGTPILYWQEDETVQTFEPEPAASKFEVGLPGVKVALGRTPR